MKFASFLALAFLVGASAAPTEESSDIVAFDKTLFIDEFLIYTAKHEIVSLSIPLNNVNFQDDSAESNSTSDDSDVLVYFVEADVKENGEKEYKGLYSLKNKVATLFLETGTDASTAGDETVDVYFSATDGIYIYDAKTKKTEKYGTVTGNFVGIAKINGTDELYVLSNEGFIYKISDNGNKKVKLENIENVKQIVLDFSNNLYYYSDDKKPHVVTEDGVKEIVGLPEEPSYVQLVRPPFILEDGAVFISGEKVYFIYANGTSEFTDLELKVRLSAFAPDAALIQYYALDKKIYEYNVLKIILGDLLDDLKKFLEDKSDEIQEIASRSRDKFRA